MNGDFLNIIVNDTSQFVVEDAYTDLSFGFRIGKEYRQKIDKNFDLRYGLDIGYQYSYRRDYDEYQNKSKEYTTTSHTPCVNLVLGLNYTFKEKLVLGFETLPTFAYTASNNHWKNEVFDTPELNNERETNTNTFRFAFDSSSLLFTLAYKW